MHGFFFRLPRTFARSFKGYRILFHLFAIALTYLIVRTGFDWTYFSYFEHSSARAILFSAAIIGGIFPILLPLILYGVGVLRKSAPVTKAAHVLGQAAILGWFTSSLYKFFTGRAGPEMHSMLPTPELAQMFRFGFLRGGIFWGWPSSHAAVAFAMAIALVILFPKRPWLFAFAILYALFISIGVSMTIHWFSDAASGALIGTAIGVAVGKNFKTAPEIIFRR